MRVRSDPVQLYFTEDFALPLSSSEYELPKERSRAQTEYPKSLFRKQLLSIFPSDFNQVLVEEERVRRGRENRCKGKGVSGKKVFM